LCFCLYRFIELRVPGRGGGGGGGVCCGGGGGGVGFSFRGVGFSSSWFSLKLSFRAFVLSPRAAAQPGHRAVGTPPRNEVSSGT